MRAMMKGSDIPIILYLSMGINVIFPFIPIETWFFGLKKKRQAGQSPEESADFISNLQEDLMNLILMRVPIKDAVRTSILSKKWRYKWSSIPELAFDHNCQIKGASVMERANVVEQVLLQHVGSIDKFSCIFYVPRCSQIDSWILILSRNGIKEFILKVKSKDYCDVPSTIFLLCPKLCLLQLFNCALKVPPTFTGLHNLLVLQLRFCKFSEDDIAYLISESPLLEKLTLAGFSFSKRLNIHAPNLRYLEIFGNFPDLSLGSSPRLTDVSIILHLPNDYSDYLEHHNKTCSLIHFTGCLHGIERVAFKVDFLKFLSIHDIPKKLPAIYDHLKYLEVEIELNSKEILTTLSILRSSPNLKALKIKYWVDEDGKRFYPSNEEAEFWRAKTQFDGLLSNLLTVEIIGVATLLDLEFIRCILSNAPVLERMKIYTSEYVEHEEFLKIVEEFSQFRRAFARVEIIWMGHYRDQMSKIARYVGYFMDIY